MKSVMCQLNSLCLNMMKQDNIARRHDTEIGKPYEMTVDRVAGVTEANVWRLSMEILLHGFDV